MNRFGSAFLTAFRVIQLFLSLTALACGAFILYEFLALGSSAHDLETILVLLQDPKQRQQIGTTSVQISNDQIASFVTVLNKVLVPILRYFQMTPVRAIVVTFAGVWSTGVIIYMTIAQRTTKRPNLNKRSVRVTLEALALLFWIGCILSAATLAGQYGFLALAGGAPTKLAFDGLKPLIKEALQKITKPSNIAEAISVVDCLITIGALSILTTGASVVCMSVSLLSIIVACCVSGKPRKGKHSKVESDEEAAQNFLPPVPEKLAVTSVTAEISSHYEHVSPITPMTPAVYHNHNFQHKNGYQALPPYRGAVGQNFF